MPFIIENGVCICVEKEYVKDFQEFQELLSFYDRNGSCYGSYDITNEDIYEIENPYFYSDVFVFQKKHFKHFIDGDIDTVCFLKINRHNRIEEIGFDFASRFCLEKGKIYKKATPLHKIPFLLISDEMWISLKKEK